MAHILHERHCLRCGHLWLPRQFERPAVCPSCKQKFWDLPPRPVGRPTDAERKRVARIYRKRGVA